MLSSPQGRLCQGGAQHLWGNQDVSTVITGVLHHFLSLLSNIKTKWDILTTKYYIESLPRFFCSAEFWTRATNRWEVMWTWGPLQPAAGQPPSAPSHRSFSPASHHQQTQRGEISQRPSWGEDERSPEGHGPPKGEDQSLLCDLFNSQSMFTYPVMIFDDPPIHFGGNNWLVQIVWISRISVGWYWSFQNASPCTLAHRLQAWPGPVEQTHPLRGAPQLVAHLTGEAQRLLVLNSSPSRNPCARVSQSSQNPGLFPIEHKHIEQYAVLLGSLKTEPLCLKRMKLLNLYWTWVIVM